MQHMKKYHQVQHSVDTDGLGLVALAYKARLMSGELQQDALQMRVVEKLDALQHSLASLPPVPSFTDKTNTRLFLNNKMQKLWHRFAPDKLMNKKHFNSRPSGFCPRSMYIHGPVGVGKSFLMDLFYASMNGVFEPDNGYPNTTSNMTKRRVHFHEFMLDAHYRVFQKIWRLLLYPR